MDLREISTDALRYWEKGRVVYNLALLVVTAVTAVTTVGVSVIETRHVTYCVIALVVLAVVANLLYCVVYPIDVFIQLSEFREAWRRWRWVLLVIGTLFACMLAAMIIASKLLPLYAFL